MRILLLDVRNLHTHECEDDFAVRKIYNVLNDEIGERLVLQDKDTTIVSDRIIGVHGYYNDKKDKSLIGKIVTESKIYLFTKVPDYNS